MVPIQRLGIMAVLTVMMIAAGCRRQGLAERDEQERRDPAIQAAWAVYETGDVARAEALYQEILKTNPDFARAHLDVAMILMNAEEKPLKSIYHFMRYLELRPDAEKKDLVNQNIRKLTALLSGKVAKSRIGQLEVQLMALQAENDSLKRSLGISGLPMASIAAPAPEVRVAPALVPAPVPPPPPPPTGPRAYTVKSGDSLSRIAQSMYGDGMKAEKIFEANRGKLKSRNALQAGQVLVIPP